MQKIRGNEISMIFQEPMTSLNPIIRCGKQIAESLRLHRGMKKKEAMEEAIKMMQLLVLPIHRPVLMNIPTRCPAVCASV